MSDTAEVMKIIDDYLECERMALRPRKERSPTMSPVISDLLIISRQNALELGLKHYFTCKPCRKGHVSTRYVNGMGCVSCMLDVYKNNRERKIANSNEYYKNNRETQLKKKAAFYIANRDKYLERQNAYNMANKITVRERKRKAVLKMRIAYKVVTELGINLEDIINAASI